MTKKVLIIGGGFGGVSTALKLSRSGRSDIAVTLVSDVPHFEYRPALYRVVAGRSPRDVCVPLTEIFSGKDDVEVIKDKIDSINFEQREARGISEKTYGFDYLVVATGSETSFFDIPGLENFSFGFKTIIEAVKLRQHIESRFASCDARTDNADEKLKTLHFVIVGAGPSGVELAGELAVYARKLSKKYKVDPTYVTFELFEAAPRILPTLPEVVSERAMHRLRHLGVNIYTNRPITSEEIEKVKIRGMSMETETVIWTSGVRPNALYRADGRFESDRRGRVVVDEYMQVIKREGVFVAGDGAATPFTGMAQTASHDGKTIAENIIRLIDARPLIPYQPKKPYHVLPIGPMWAVTKIGPFVISGTLAWLIRRAADFRYFLSILPFSKAISVFQDGKTICSACEICLSVADEGKGA